MMLTGIRYTISGMRGLLLALLAASLLAACGTSTPVKRPTARAILYEPQPVSEKGNEIALYAMGMIDTGYQLSLIHI